MIILTCYFFFLGAASESGMRAGFVAGAAMLLTLVGLVMLPVYGIGAFAQGVGFACALQFGYLASGLLGIMLSGRTTRHA